LLSHIPRAVLEAIYTERFDRAWDLSPTSSEQTSVVAKRVRELVDSIFSAFNLKKDGHLTPNEFRECLSSNPGIVTYLSSVFPYGSEPNEEPERAAAAAGTRRVKHQSATAMQIKQPGMSVVSTPLAQPAQAPALASTTSPTLPAAPAAIHRSSSAPNEAYSIPPIPNMGALARAQSSPGAPRMQATGLEMLLPALATAQAALRQSSANSQEDWGKSNATVGLSCGRCGLILRHSPTTGAPLHMATCEAVFRAAEGWVLSVRSAPAARPHSSSKSSSESESLMLVPSGVSSASYASASTQQASGSSSATSPPKRAGTPPPLRVNMETARLSRRSLATQVIREGEREESDSPYAGTGTGDQFGIGCSPKPMVKILPESSNLSSSSQSSGTSVAAPAPKVPAAAVKVPALRSTAGAVTATAPSAAGPQPAFVVKPTGDTPKPSVSVSSRGGSSSASPMHGAHQAGGRSERDRARSEPAVGLPDHTAGDADTASPSKSLPASALRTPPRKSSLEETVLAAANSSKGIAFSCRNGNGSPSAIPPGSPAQVDLAASGSSGSASATRPPTAPSPSHPPAEPHAEVSLSSAAGGINMPPRQPGHDIYGPSPALRSAVEGEVAAVAHVFKHKFCMGCGAAYTNADWKPLSPEAVSWMNIAGALWGRPTANPSSYTALAQASNASSRALPSWGGHSVPASPGMSPLANFMAPPPGVDTSTHWELESRRAATPGQGDDEGSTIISGDGGTPLGRSVFSGARSTAFSPAKGSSTEASGIGFVSAGHSPSGLDGSPPMYGSEEAGGLDLRGMPDLMLPPAGGADGADGAETAGRHALLAAAHLQWWMHHTGVNQNSSMSALHSNAPPRRQRSMSADSKDSGGSNMADTQSVGPEQRVRSMSQSDAMGRMGRAMDDAVAELNLSVPPDAAPQAVSGLSTPPHGPSLRRKHSIGGDSAMSSPGGIGDVSSSVGPDSPRHEISPTGLQSPSASSVGGRSAATATGPLVSHIRPRGGSYSGPEYFETGLLPHATAAGLRQGYQPGVHHPADSVYAAMQAAAAAVTQMASASQKAPAIAAGSGQSRGGQSESSIAASGRALSSSRGNLPRQSPVVAATLAASGHKPPAFALDERAGSIVSGAAATGNGGDSASVRSGIDPDNMSMGAPATAGGGQMSSLGAGTARTLAMHGAEMLEHEGELWKKGRRTGAMTRRWYYLCQNFLYWYKDQETHIPKGSLFLEGSYVSVCNDQMARGYFGIRIHTASAHGDQERVLYCKDTRERDEWMSVLTRACRTVAFEQVYRRVKELGQGRFSQVVEVQNRDTGLHYAVKIINKNELKPEEKELLRTEIAILRLVQHPHIIRLEDVFETSATMYIVMELIKGGELFDNIVGRSRFTENEARQLIKPLVDAVAYLHSLGIVHRDIKPENILCGDKVHDVSIADFGLSKLVHPNEVMTMPCGTLTYVAPEVLSMQGYHMEADMWSIGVIMYLVVRGRLPYDGDEQQAIVQRILHEPLDFSSGVWAHWSKCGVEFIQKLLEKNPDRRLTARQALQHPWLRQPPPDQTSPEASPSAAQAAGRA